MSDIRWRRFATVSTMILIAASYPLLAQTSTAPAMSVCQARRTIVEKMQHVGIAPFWMNSQPSNVRFSAVEFEFQAEPGPSVSKQFWFKNLFPSANIQRRSEDSWRSDGRRQDPIFLAARRQRQESPLRQL